MAFKTEKHLVEAIEQCQLKKIVDLVDHGYNIHVQNTLGQNFLIYLLQQQQQDSALSKKRFHIFQYLIIKYNLNIHLFDYNHKNVFNWASNLNCTKEALYLLNANPGDIDILARDQSGSCSLHYAVEHGNETLVHAIVNYLLRYRLRFDIKDAHNNSPEDLAKKLGYDKIANFLSQACRSTVFMSREIPSPPLSLQQQQQPQQQQSVTNKSRLIKTRNSCTTMGSLSSLVDSSENFNLIETKISEAKRFDNWKTVAALRTSTRKTYEKSLNPMQDYIPLNTTRTSIIPSVPKLPPIEPIKQISSQSEQMLHLIEPQISPSYRPSFKPIYPRSILTNLGSQRSGYAHSKTSSHRRSSVLSRKRDSEISQLSSSTLQDIQSRFSLPAMPKSHRQSLVTTN